MATTLGSVAVGSSVYLNVNRKRTEFLVVHQGLPGSMYDSSCDGTWLLMKDIYEKRQWHSSNINSYKASTIHTYLNGTFLKLFDTDIKAQIKTVKIPYVNGTGSSAVASGSSGLSTQIFLLSGYEVGWTQTNSDELPIDGDCLSFFSGSGNKKPLRVAYLEGTATPWFLRSPYTVGTSRVNLVAADGGAAYSNCSVTSGVRPALILPDNMGVDDSGNITEPVAPPPHGSMINNVLCVTKKCYAMINGVLCAVPYGLANVDGVMTRIQFEEPEPPAPPAQTYTVTITTTPTQNHDANFAYFQINGTKYDGSKAVTLSVQEGTTWTAYVSNYSTSTAGIYIDGKKQNNNQVTGTVTSNMDAKAYCTVDPNSYTIYPNVVIKTNQ